MRSVRARPDRWQSGGKYAAVTQSALDEDLPLMRLNSCAPVPDIKLVPPRYQEQEGASRSKDPTACDRTSGAMSLPLSKDSGECPLGAAGIRGAAVADGGDAA
jgi:hypothetical protein